MKGKYYSAKVKGLWCVTADWFDISGRGLLKHFTEKAALGRCDRARRLEEAGAVSPADLITIRDNLVLSRREFAAELHIAVRTLEDYEQAKRRISPVVYELAQRIGAENE